MSLCLCLHLMLRVFQDDPKYMIMICEDQPYVLSGFIQHNSPDHMRYHSHENIAIYSVTLSNVYIQVVTLTYSKGFKLKPLNDLKDK